MHDTATSKKTGDFLQATRLRRKLPQLFDFYVKSHAWFGGGAILLRGPLRLKPSLIEAAETLAESVQSYFEAL